MASQGSVFAYESYAWTGRNTTSIPVCSQIARVVFVFDGPSTKPIGVVAMACDDAVALTGSLYVVQLGLPLLFVLHDMPNGAQVLVVVPLLFVARHTSVGLTTTEVVTWA